MDNKQKRFEFPENISSGYGVFLGLTLMELFKYVVPTLIIVTVILFLPPYGFTIKSIELFIALIVVTIVIAVITSQPVKHRNNIRLPKYLKMKNQYSKRNKLFFIGRKINK